MKIVVAVIQPDRLTDVKNALLEAKIGKLTVSNVIGAGQQMGYTENYRGAIEEINLIKKVRIEILVNENFVEACIEAIIKGARTGKIGDGKIWVQDLTHVVRIRTGDVGNDAIG